MYKYLWKQWEPATLQMAAIHVKILKSQYHSEGKKRKQQQKNHNLLHYATDMNC